MLKRFFPLLLILAFVRIAAGQTPAPPPPKDDFEISDIPEEESHPYFGVGGGINLHIVNLNFVSINAMTKTLGIPALDKGLLMTGGSGFITAPFGKNMRIGGSGFGGKINNCADVIDTINGAPVKERRTAEFGMGGGGLTLEYVIPLTFTRNKVIVTGGIMLGLGSMSLQLDQTTSDPRTWNNYFTGGSSANFTRQIHAGFIAYQPYVNVEYSLFAFLMLRGSVGYNGTIVGTWTVDRAIAISGVPDINGNGFMFGGGLFLGIFR